jgi:hypothetical protein
MGKSTGDKVFENKTEQVYKYLELKEIFAIGIPDLTCG